jgi:hypothetical protein
MSVVLYEGAVATPRIVDLGGRRSVPDAAITLPIVCCQASPSVRMRSITHHGLRKRFWRHPNNPIAPRKFPRGWCKSTPSEDLVHCIFSLMRTRRRCDRVVQSPSGLNARTLNATTGRLATLQAPGLRGRRRM